MRLPLQYLAEMAQDLGFYANQLEIIEIVVKAESDYESLNEVEATIFRELVRSNFNLWEHAFYSHNEGILSDPLWRVWNSSFCDDLSVEWFRAFEFYSGGRSFLPGFLELQESCYRKKRRL